jgi:two-component system NtrC family sensor kinase
VSADLLRFGGDDRRHLQLALSRATRRAETMEEAASVTCRILYDQLETETPVGRKRACVLVRCFKTHLFGLLAPDLQLAAESRLPEGVHPTPDLRCMTLLASAGDRPEWCSRHTSRRFRATPIDHGSLASMPMWRGLFHQCGMAIPGAPSAETDDGESQFMDRSHRSYNVFCVEQALGSPSVPDQDGFVVPFQVASVIGFGGQLRRGDVYAMLLFTCVPVTRQVAMQVNAIALEVTSTLFRFEESAVFAT